jgi:hypothetical protein
MISAITKHSISLGALTILGHLLTQCKVSFIIGSHAAFFSATQWYTPLLGRYGGSTYSIVYYLLRTLHMVLAKGSFSLAGLTYYIPTLIGGLYSDLLVTNSMLKRTAMALVCMACMVLFCCHEVGGQAWAYTLFWLIPIAVTQLAQPTVFLQALASTLATHAVGSVFWLYSNPMTPQVWLSLIPVVCLERFVFAVGITLASKAIDKVHAFLKAQQAAQIAAAQ